MLSAAGDYRFSVSAECVGLSQQFNRFLRHAPGDAYVNFALGGVVSSSSADTWTLKYASCAYKTGECENTCPLLGGAIIDFRERVQPGSVFPVTVAVQSNNPDPEVIPTLCKVYLRFAVPSNCSVSAYGTAWSQTGVFRELLLESHSQEGYSYYTLAADPGFEGIFSSVVYQVKIERP